MSSSRRGKKENNRKNYEARAAFIAHQRENRPKQVWMWDNPIGTRGHWEKQ